MKYLRVQFNISVERFSSSIWQINWRINGSNSVKLGHWVGLEKWSHLGLLSSAFLMHGLNFLTLNSESGPQSISLEFLTTRFRLRKLLS
jgi:hypothetical protein